MVSSEIIFAEIGAGLWGVGLVFLRNAGPTIFENGNETLFALTYVAVAPITAFSYEAAAAMAKVDPANVECFRGWSVAVATAALIDGIAICCFPKQTYALQAPGMAMAGASLLWGIALAIAYGLVRTV